MDIIDTHVTAMLTVYDVRACAAPMCPADEDPVMLSVNGTDLFIVAGGTGTGANPMSAVLVDPELALSGSGQSVTFPDTEFFIVKENCPGGGDFRLLGLSLMVKGASNVLILVTGEQGTLKAQAMVNVVVQHEWCWGCRLCQSSSTL